MRPQLALSFEQFEHAMANAFDGIVGAGGISHGLRRFNSKKLDRIRGEKVTFFIDPTGLFGPGAIVFLDGCFFDSCPEVAA